MCPAWLLHGGEAHYCDIKWWEMALPDLPRELRNAVVRQLFPRAEDIIMAKEDLTKSCIFRPFLETVEGTNNVNPHLARCDREGSFRLGLKCGAVARLGLDALQLGFSVD